MSSIGLDSQRIVHPVLLIPVTGAVRVQLTQFPIPWIPDVAFAGPPDRAFAHAVRVRAAVRVRRRAAVRRIKFVRSTFIKITCPAPSIPDSCRSPFAPFARIPRFKFVQFVQFRFVRIRAVVDQLIGYLYLYLPTR